ncbi:hypothetical protein COCON_G00184810 [Conger conger]|uniref:Uncharacterized protein n=1 Tax=Conger conger TaxID=82655 RepID=A0A9Q1D2L3_CONCO|nr:hypothetical protein COCON_G00184810 [Conger conger]
MSRVETPHSQHTTEFLWALLTACSGPWPMVVFGTPAEVQTGGSVVLIACITPHRAPRSASCSRYPSSCSSPDLSHILHESGPQALSAFAGRLGAPFGPFLHPRSSAHRSAGGTALMRPDGAPSRWDCGRRLAGYYQQTAVSPLRHPPGSANAPILVIAKEGLGVALARGRRTRRRICVPTGPGPVLCLHSPSACALPQVGGPCPARPSARPAQRPRSLSWSYGADEPGRKVLQAEAIAAWAPAPCPSPSLLVTHTTPAHMDVI